MSVMTTRGPLQYPIKRLSLDVVKSRIREIDSLNYRIAFKLDRRLDSRAAEVSVKF